MAGVTVEIDSKLEQQVLAIMAKHGWVNSVEASRREAIVKLMYGDNPMSYIEKEAQKLGLTPEMLREEAEKILWSEIEESEKSAGNDGWVDIEEVWKKLGV